MGLRVEGLLKALNLAMVSVRSVAGAERWLEVVKQELRMEGARHV